jgi:2-polyprenyl-3-methyl-5-hydroxy-6-metoxy-1,4-benzoquinol methylase
MNNLENLDYKPDVIIFSEVIEHLMNIEIALSNLKKIMTSDTLLIIDTPNAFYI